MRFYFSWKVSFICLLLIVGMLRLSYWQWTRHQEKVAYIEQMQQRLAEPETEISSLLAQSTDNWEKLYYRRAIIAGEYDFKNEVLLQNRSYQDHKGVHVLTPLKISEREYILVDRGFLPLHLAKSEKRKSYQQPKTLRFIGLIKEPKEKGFFLAPSDSETGPGLPRVDSFLRVDLARIEKQLPYRLLPFYVEIMNTQERTKVSEQIVKSSSGKTDIFFLPGNETAVKDPKELENLELPIATFDTIIPAGRHFGYVFEWGFMAFATMLIGIILQFRRPRRIPSLHPADRKDI